MRITIDRTGKIFTVAGVDELTDREIAEQLKGRLKVGDLIQWGGG